MGQGTQSSEGMNGVGGATAKWLILVPGEFVQVVGRRLQFLARAPLPRAGWASSQHGSWLPHSERCTRERESEVEAARYFTTDPRRSCSIISATFYLLKKERGISFTEGRNIKEFAGMVENNPSDL